MAKPDLSEFHELTEIEELRRVASELQGKLRRAQAKTAELIDAAHAGAREAAVILGNPPAVPKPKPDRRSRGAEVALLHVSDLHFGKQTPSFDTTVAHKRLQTLGGKVEKIAAVERADHPVRECRLLLGGDLAENLGIFAGQIYEVDSATFAQVFAAASALEELARHLLGIFERVVVDEVFGNHGRIGRKGDNPRGDNIDRFIGAILRDRLKAFEDAGRLEWRSPHGWYAVVEIGNYRALLVHGDQVKSFGGQVPSFGIARKANAWASGVLGVEFSDVFMGHFHQPLSVPLANGKGRVFVNPSIESDSAYAQEMMAATGVPGQRLFFIDAHGGRITSERVLWLD